MKIDAVSEHSLILMVFPNNIGDLLASHQAGDFLAVEFPRNLRGTFDCQKYGRLSRMMSFLWKSRALSHIAMNALNNYITDFLPLSPF